MTINIDNHAVDLIIERVRRRYPDFQSVHDAAFKVDETDNKRKASALAREKLSEDSLDELIAQAAWSDVIGRVEEVAKATDLLYLTMPRKGDLGLLYYPDLDKAAFARAIRDLLFGEGDSPERLGRFVQWTEDEGLPSKWTLPSYLLFLCFPDTEIFVKPRVLTRFMRLMDPGFKHPRPGAAGYSAIRETAEFLKRALTDVGVADMIDVQSVMWVAGTAEDRFADIATQTLAKPFDQIFDSYTDARHAFRRLREMFDALGISGPDDKRFTLSLPRKYRGKTLRFIFGPWLILDFVEGEEVLHTLKENELGYKRLGESFAVKEGEPDFIFYELPLEDFLGEDEALEAVRQASLNLIAEKFSGWKATPYRSKNNPHLAEAVFSDEKLRTLLTSGLPAHAEVTRAPTALFSARSFELMAALAETPTRAFYDEHREDFRRFVEQPFRDLFRGVHGEMPEVIRDHMETQSRLFSRIVKNDWGRGGAWPHYWAAFYPKGGRRIEEAQLFAGITGEGFEFGFAIGEYGTTRHETFRRNVSAHRAALRRVLGDALSGGEYSFGDLQDDELFEVDTFEEWLDEEAVVRPRVARVLGPQEVASTSAKDLIALVAHSFIELFPLVLLATESDAMPLVSAYLEKDEEDAEPNPVYTASDLERDTGFTDTEIKRWLRAIERKKQIVLYGPPGTGKTYLADRLARHLVSETDGVTDVIQFHPAYTYEDFFQGIRPQPHHDGGLHYPLVPGRFKEFCEKARQREGTCVLIIDEINRANLSQVFGELMYLLEYRERDISLAGGKRFRIPANVRIIGTLNTADRSIALVDHALRRRFAFIHLPTRYDILELFHKSRGEDVTGLIGVLKQVNKEIGDPNYEVGVSFFLREDLRDQLADIWEMEIEPYLEEYFFDQLEKVQSFRWPQIMKSVVA